MILFKHNGLNTIIYFLFSILRIINMFNNNNYNRTVTLLDLNIQVI